MKYKVYKQEWEEYCEHPKCSVLHRNRRKFHWVFRHGGDPLHIVIRREWIVVNENGDRMGDAYPTAREARSEMEWSIKEGIYPTEEKTA